MKKKKNIILIIIIVVLSVITFKFVQLSWTNTIISSIKNNDIHAVERQLTSVTSHLFNIDSVGGGPFPLIFFAGTFAETPLGVSCSDNKPDMVEVLLRYGADPNNKGLAKSPPIIIAVENGSNDLESTKKIIDLLVEYDVDVNSVDEETGDFVLNSIASIPVANYKEQIGVYNEEEAKYVLEMYRNMEALVKNDYPKDRFNQTVLMDATATCNIELINYLLEKNFIDINEKDDEGRTAVYYLIGRNMSFKTSEKIIQIYIHYKINLDSKDNANQTFYDYAKDNNEVEIINYLDEEIY